MIDKVQQFQKMINECENIVFFGGAGVSTASGIPDFRGSRGLYKQAPEYLLSHSYYVAHTDKFFEFYKDKVCAIGYEPNITHKKLVELEEIGKLKAVITQNIDGLHQMAGSKNVIELHGTIHRNYCEVCKKQFSAKYVKESIGIPLCDECNSKYAIVRPDIVLYEEQLPNGVISKSTNLISQADMLIIAGTSLNVYPAACLIDDFHGKYLVLINKGSVHRNTRANLVIDEDMTKVFELIQVK